MTTKNAATVNAQHQAFNRHDVEAATSGYADSVVFTDHAMGVSLKSVQEIKDHVRMYLDAASDGRVAIREFIEAGDTIVLELTFTGTNDGPLGPLPATGRHITLDGVDIFRFDTEGRIVSEEWYYDQLALLVQLGHMQPPKM